MTIQYIGMPPQPIQCMLVTVQELNYHMCTFFGTSYSSLHNDSDIPFQGKVSIRVLELVRPFGLQSAIHLLK